MDCVQQQLNCLMSYWNIPRVITYPTPPYMTLRRNIGPHPKPLLARPRELLDMITKYSTADDRKYFRPSDEESFIQGDVFVKGNGQQSSSIHDKANKWMFYNNLSGLLAVLGKNSGGAIFEITQYKNDLGDKVPVTLRLVGKNGYLSCSEGKLTIEDQNSVGSLDQIMGETKRFLFLRPRSLENVTFESLGSPGKFMCTTTNNTSPVSVSDIADNTKITNFIIDKELGGSFIMMLGDRLSLQVPMEVLESLQENDQLMPNTYERFPYGTSRNDVCWNTTYLNENQWLR